METIAGRVSLGKAVGRTIARRLSRARTRSRELLTVVPAGLVIGVSVEEATVEAVKGEGEGADCMGVAGEGGDDRIPRTPHGTTFVYAEAALQKEGTRSRRSTISMPNAPPGLVMAAQQQQLQLQQQAVEEKKSTPSSWMTKARDITRMLKRRSMAVLPQNSSP